ncbi:MAG: hypothetical protein AAFV37_09490 [Pseudomonadota bacterium]
MLPKQEVTVRIRNLFPLSFVFLAGCASAAQFGDEAIRRGTMDRVSATPFTTLVESQDCRERLTPKFGIQNGALAVYDGVQVAQTFTCEGPDLTAHVSLKNLTAKPMYCYTVSDDRGIGAWVGPNGVAFYEYAFQFDASHACSETG